MIWCVKDYNPLTIWFPVELKTTTFTKLLCDSLSIRKSILAWSVHLCIQNKIKLTICILKADCVKEYNKT